MLEYLLFRAALFNSEHKNLCKFEICENHFEYLTTADRKDNCKICKAIRQRPTSLTNSLQYVSKSMALRIWKQGQPTQTWAVYEQSICTGCRKHFAASDGVEEAGLETDHIFGEFLKYIYCFDKVELVENKLPKIFEV